MTKTVLAFASLLAFSVGTAHAQVSIVGNTVHEKETAAGSSYEGAVRIRNISSTSQDVRIYVTDYLGTPDGRHSYPELGTTPRSNGQWVSIIVDRARIAAGEEAEIPYTVAVPTGLTAGSYWSMVMVESIQPTDPIGLRNDPTKRVQVGMVTVVRYAVQLVTHVAGDASSRIEFASTQLSRDEAGNGVLSFNVANTGDRAHWVNVSAEIYDAQGNPAGEYSEPAGIVYPDGGTRREIPLSSLPIGDYTILLFADTGADEVFGAQYSATVRQ